MAKLANPEPYVQYAKFLAYGKKPEIGQRDRERLQYCEDHSKVGGGRIRRGFPVGWFTSIVLLPGGFEDVGCIVEYLFEKNKGGEKYVSQIIRFKY